MNGARRSTACSAARSPANKRKPVQTIIVKACRTTSRRSCHEPVDIRVAQREPWYKYGVAMLLFEMALAVAVSGYSLYMTFNGLGHFSGKQ